MAAASSTLVLMDLDSEPAATEGPSATPSRTVTVSPADRATLASGAAVADELAVSVAARLELGSVGSEPTAPQPAPSTAAQPTLPDEAGSASTDDAEPVDDPGSEDQDDDSVHLSGPTPLSTWEAVASCESGYGGEPDWSINTGNGYYGGLQFNIDSWRWVGGRGYPHEASKAEQIARAEILLERQGWRAWPACSLELGLR